MVPRITAVVTRLKTDRTTQLQADAILAACQEAGSTSWRDRVLTPVTTLKSGRLPFAVQPTSRPAPNAPSSPPPEMARKRAGGLGPR